MSPKLATGDNYNRIFILGGKGCSDSELRSEFEKYGVIKDIHIIKDRKTNESKGIIYITYSKASEAALAIEEMNGKPFSDSLRPIKVILANDRSEGSVRDPKEEEKMLRLFIIVPPGYGQEDIEKDFTKFGDVEYVRIVKDRGTKEMRLAYVKYFRSYHAALALENCDPHYKPVFAATPSSRPARSRSQEHNSYVGGGGGGGGAGGGYDYADSYGGSSRQSSNKYSDYIRTSDVRSSNYDVTGVADMLRSYPNHGDCLLQAVLINSLSQESVGKLFDLIPGMEYCQYDSTTGAAAIKYSTAQCAAYARDRLDGFEYPIGYRITVRFYTERSTDALGRYDAYGHDALSESIEAVKQSMNAITQDGDPQNSFQVLVQTVEKAANLIKQVGLVSVGAGGGGGGGASSSTSSSGQQHVRYTKVALPPTKPLAQKECPVKERLFIVISPDIVPDYILEDCFCRFGNMISAYFMPGRKYGYVKYADADSARAAIDCLHGQTICGNYLKVILADPPKGGDRFGKRDRNSGDYTIVDDDVMERKVARIE